MRVVSSREGPGRCYPRRSDGGPAVEYGALTYGHHWLAKVWRRLLPPPATYGCARNQRQR
jgi:hypothetical protein